MLGQYTTYIRNREGVFTHRLTDITSVKLLEKLNAVGSWLINSTTPEKPPFEAGDGIVILKNGAVYYSGVLSKVSYEYDGYNRLYQWSTSGGNDLVYLSRRVCHPDPVSLMTDSESHYTDSGPLGEVLARLIDINAGVTAQPTRRIPFLEATVVKNAGQNVSVSLRFDNLLTVVAKLLNEQDFVIRPVWDPAAKKLHYEISAGADASDKLVFSTALNQIRKLSYSLMAPTGNYVISAGKGVKTDRYFCYAENADSMEQWGRVEAYHDMRAVNDSDLQADADAYLANSQTNEGYSAELSSNVVGGYKKVWNLGDDVGIVVDGKTYRSRLLQVDTNLQYDEETISPTVGTVEKGQLNPIFQQLDGLRSDVNQLLKVSD